MTDMHQILVLNLNTQFDPDYGRWDIAPRIMGTPWGDFPGQLGWLISVRPNRPDNECYYICWEKPDTGFDWVRLEDFEIIAGVVH